MWSTQWRRRVAVSVPCLMPGNWAKQRVTETTSQGVVQQGLEVTETFLLSQTHKSCSRWCLSCWKIIEGGSEYQAPPAEHSQQHAAVKHVTLEQNQLLQWHDGFYCAGRHVNVSNPLWLLCSVILYDSPPLVIFLLLLNHSKILTHSIFNIIYDCTVMSKGYSRIFDIGPHFWLHQSSFYW